MSYEPMRDLLAAQSPLLQDLVSADVNRQLAAMAKRRHYQDGQLIHSRGEANPGLSIVRGGAVRVGNLGSDGSYLTTSVLGQGQCFGEFTLFAGLPRTHEAIAVGDTRLDQLPKRRFLQLFDQEPQLSKALLTISLRRTHGLLEFVDDLRRLPLPVRVAKFLQTNATSAQLVVRQQDMAFTFGVSRVSMGKVLKVLERAGLIEQGYGRITIIDLDKFTAWLNERILVTPVEQT